MRLFHFPVPKYRPIARQVVCSMAQALKVLVIDDDPWFYKIFEKRFHKRFPDFILDSKQTPEAVDGYDVYVIDNDFKGTPQLKNLAAVLGQKNPKPTIFGLSGTMDDAKRKTIKEWGCKDAFEKANPDDLEKLFSGIEQCKPLGKTEMSKNVGFKVLMLDDDPDIHKIFKMQFRNKFPNLQLDTSLQPDAPPGYDVYVIDNEFAEGKVGGSLAQTIRKQSPDAVIIAHSATLDTQTLKLLLNNGCSGACEKGNPKDLEVLFNLIAACELEKRKKQDSAASIPVITPPTYSERPSTSGSKGIFAALRTAADLLREWNARLDQK